MIRELDYLRQVRQVAGRERYSIAAIGSARLEWQDALQRTGLFVPASCRHKRRKIIHEDWDGENILLCMAPVHSEAKEAIHDFIHYLLRHYYREPEQEPAKLNITPCSRLMQKNISTRDAPPEAFLFEIYCRDHAMPRRDELQALRRAVSLLTLLVDNYCMAHDVRHCRDSVPIARIVTPAVWPCLQPAARRMEPSRDRRNFR